MKCCVGQCPNEATEEPVLRFPRTKEKIIPGIRGRLFGLAVCAEHGAAPIEEVVDDAAWARIKAGYEGVGFPVPDRATASLSFEHIIL